MRRATLLLVFLSACKPTDDAASSSTAVAKEPIAVDKPVAKTSPEGEVTDKPATPDASRPGKPAALEPGKVRELRKQYSKLLDEGRSLTKADKLDEGMSKYRAALEIDPSNPTVLGELGWAQFKANALDDAQSTTMQALRLAQEDKARGMLLYNLGRIAEARGETEAAIVYYRTSLEKRPGNATVQERLDALLAGGLVAAPPTNGLARIAGRIADLDTACKLILNHGCLDYGGDPNAGPEDDFNRCTCEPSLHATPSDDDDSWGLLTLQVGEWFQEVEFPVVQTSSGWVVFDAIEWAFNPGMSGIFEEVHIGPTTTASLLPGATQPQVVFTWKKDRSDTDMGVNEYEAEHHEATLVCAREGEQAWCTKPLVSADSYVRDVEFLDMEEDPPIDHAGLPVSIAYAATFEWRDGKLIVSNVQRSGGAAGEHWDAGEYPLAELLGK
jgi:hypothetical protein